ncbi:hypothetical protein HN51_049416 [Arachis hypogaea]|uniref:AUGMIN subunit 4 n=1 Tax=Arachis hypogaea TaxID=3818 RepID=A0A444YF79_ARAHY|nr:hypothetical protein Ahy_B07g088673 [Arachis hypogaea]
MVKGQNAPSELRHVIDQLERYCMAPDGSLMSINVYNDLHLAREEMCRERIRYLEAMAIYSEVVAMVEEYHESSSSGGISDSSGGLHSPLGTMNSSQVHKTLEHRMAVAEAAQRLRLPLIAEDGKLHEHEDIEKLSVVSRSFIDSNSSSPNATIYSSNAANYATPRSSISGVNSAFSVIVDSAEPGIFGVPDRFLGITPAYLWQSQIQKTPSSGDMREYCKSLSREIDDRLKLKCDMLLSAFVLDVDENNSFSSPSLRTSSLLAERVKSMIEQIEREETALQENLYSAYRKFAEYYNVLEQILGVIIELFNNFKLGHQHDYDEVKKSWLCQRCEAMDAKLKVLEHFFLYKTYNEETVPALYKIREYIVEATKEASDTYNKAFTRLMEYQGLDDEFEDMAREYEDILEKLENMQWTIQQVEMDLKSFAR